jgi:uncharacterized membrane protein YdfJ with MMPL/SSD domain
MNTQLVIAVFAATAIVSLSAYAGRDGGQIGEQEKANQTAASQHAKDAAKAGKTGVRIVLPLDHGPHAQATPWLNKQRLLRAEAMEKNGVATGTSQK